MEAFASVCLDDDLVTLSIWTLRSVIGTQSSHLTHLDLDFKNWDCFAQLKIFVTSACYYMF